MKCTTLFAILIFSIIGISCGQPGTTPENGLSDKTASAQRSEPPTQNKTIMTENFKKNEEELRSRLTPLQYEVTQRKGTERAFTGEYHDFKGKGVYKCVVCGNELFGSDAKFNSGTGWPSFWQPIADSNVTSESDYSYGMVRTEVICSHCGAHLGHVFDDGPRPTGLRYCINSASLKFEGKDMKE